MLPGARLCVPDCAPLQERDAAVEKWLREEVADVCDAMPSDPGRAIPAEHVFAAIRARDADRLKKKEGEPQDRIQA